MSTHVKLIPFSESHIEKTFLWLQNPRLRHDFLMRGQPSIETHLKYFEEVLNDSSQKVFAVLCDGDHVGNCGLKHIVPNRESELWIYIGDESQQKKGIGTAATKQLISYAFNELNGELIYLHVADFNIAAIKLYEKLGFAKSTLEDSMEWRDRRTEIIRMELTRNR